jgi:excisionase family DNA binding protein
VHELSERDANGIFARGCVCGVWILPWGVAQAIQPSDDTVRAEASRLLRALRRTKHPKLSLPSGERAELPEPVAHALIEALHAVAAGQEIVVLGADRDLTTGQAAELLGVSRQYLVRLLDGETIPSYRAGSHRRVRVDDVLAFRVERDAKRRELLRQMVRDAEDAGLYD